MLRAAPVLAALVLFVTLAAPPAGAAPLKARGSIEQAWVNRRGQGRPG